MKVTLIQAKDTPTEMGVALYEGARIQAQSLCCGEDVHFNHGYKEWVCSSCNARLRSWDAGSGEWAQSSLYFMEDLDTPEQVEQAERELLEWATYWTGFPAERLTVSIRS